MNGILIISTDGADLNALDVRSSGMSVGPENYRQCYGLQVLARIFLPNRA
jgi:hypothetical protein